MVAVQQLAGAAVKGGPALPDLLLGPRKHGLAVGLGLGTAARRSLCLLVTLFLGAGLQVRGFGLGLRKDLLRLGLSLCPQGIGGGIGVFVCGAHRCNILVRSGLCGFKHLVQFQRGLRNGTGVFNMDLTLLQLGRQGSVLCSEPVLGLLESQNDLD